MVLKKKAKNPNKLNFSSHPKQTLGFVVTNLQLYSSNFFSPKKLCSFLSSYLESVWFKCFHHPILSFHHSFSKFCGPHSQLLCLD